MLEENLIHKTPKADIHSANHSSSQVLCIISIKNPVNQPRSRAKNSRAEQSRANPQSQHNGRPSSTLLPQRCASSQHPTSTPIHGLHDLHPIPIVHTSTNPTANPNPPPPRLPSHPPTPRSLPRRPLGSLSQHQSRLPATVPHNNPLPAHALHRAALIGHRPKPRDRHRAVQLPLRDRRQRRPAERRAPAAAGADAEDGLAAGRLGV